MTQKTQREMTETAHRLYQAGDFEAAAGTFADVASAYENAGDALMSAEMKNNQSVALLRARKPQLALQAALGTEKLFLENSDYKRQGVALANQAGALQAMKKSKEAMAAYKKAGDALDKAGEGEMRAEVMQLLSMLYLRHFKIYDAIIALQSGLAGVKNPTPKQKLMKSILKFRI